MHTIVLYYLYTRVRDNRRFLLRLIIWDGIDYLPALQNMMKNVNDEKWKMCNGLSCLLQQPYNSRGPGFESHLLPVEFSSVFIGFYLHSPIKPQRLLWTYVFVNGYKKLTVNKFFFYCPFNSYKEVSGNKNLECFFWQTTIEQNCNAHHRIYCSCFLYVLTTTLCSTW